MSETYRSTSTMSAPGQPLIDYTEKTPIWKMAGLPFDPDFLETQLQNLQSEEYERVYKPLRMSQQDSSNTSSNNNILSSNNTNNDNNVPTSSGQVDNNTGALDWNTFDFSTFDEGASALPSTFDEVNAANYGEIDPKNSPKNKNNPIKQ